MNTVRRRLLRAYVLSGGDPADGTEVQRFFRYVEGSLPLLPLKIRTAVEVAWHEAESVPYSSLAERVAQLEGTRVSTAATKQRVSRGARLLEEAIRVRPWHVDGTHR